MSFWTKLTVGALAVAGVYALRGKRTEGGRRGASSRRGEPLEGKELEGKDDDAGVALPAGPTDEQPRPRSARKAKARGPGRRGRGAKRAATRQTSGQ